MPRPRGDAKTGADAEHGPEGQNKQDVTPAIKETTQDSSPSRPKGQKREGSAADDAAPKRRKSTTASKPTKGQESSEKLDGKAEDDSDERPRLVTPDIEFDYDRSQLRDPRPTPGRKARPRYEEFDIPPEVKLQLESTRRIPKPEKPKGRMTNAKKDEMCIEEARTNALHAFHGLYRCHDKGRDGSPSFDAAGFQLDYDKVQNWMKPQRYNKQKMVRGMDRAVAKAQSEEEQIFDLFFETTKDSEKIAARVTDFVKDQVSKDLDIPFHQIKPEHVRLWRDKGFQPVKYEEWWKEPTAEENKRFMKMMGGASLRKDL